MKGTTFSVYDKFEYIKLIGQGAYGVVCAANNKQNNTKIAIKKVNLISLDSNINP